jgi:hypothetical protein
MLGNGHEGFPPETPGRCPRGTEGNDPRYRRRQGVRSRGLETLDSARSSDHAGEDWTDENVYIPFMQNDFRH